MNVEGRTGKRCLDLVGVKAAPAGFNPDWNCENARILKEVASDISARLGFPEPKP